MKKKQKQESMKEVWLNNLFMICLGIRVSFHNQYEYCLIKLGYSTFYEDKMVILSKWMLISF